MEGLQDALTIAQALLKRRTEAPPYSREVFDAVARTALTTLGIDQSLPLLRTVVAELQARYTISIGVETVLEDKETHKPWYFGERATPGPFADRYFRYLSEREGWPVAAIASLQNTTQRVLSLLEDPLREGAWDRRGLVVGHVQSGKTANYAGLICRAADAGYKLIVVLGGMHNALRAQTQMRLDRDFLGYESSRNAAGGRRPIGVSEIDGRPVAHFLTSRETSGDFNAARAATTGVGVQDVPVLLVVKKNASILKNLNAWVDDFLEKRGLTKTVPLLLIDDEADQASVDTKDQTDATGNLDPEHDPTRINKEIRAILKAFSRSAYVAYTATPFANILIHDEVDNRRYADDLFPRSFIVNLPAPSNYVGPSFLFSDEFDPPDLVRVVDQTKEDWIPEKHDSAWTPIFGGERTLPPSLEDAVLSFLLVCAARLARGQSNKHNSMLVHVSRFKQVQEHVHGQVKKWLDDARGKLRLGIGDEGLRQRLQTLWEEDFEPTSNEVISAVPWSGATLTSWADVSAKLTDAAELIEVRLVNSDIKEPLDYDRYTGAGGLNVIAVGGDKLSRGLTLEGLSISYFLRASRMYDSLMQMGRWFGYRPGYLDLCRIYMPADLRDWFEHVARAAEDLRSQLDHMAAINATPKDYGLRVQTHDVLMVTATNKQRYGAEYDLSYVREVKFPTLFSTRLDEVKWNADLVADALAAMGAPVADATRPNGSRIAGRLWRGVGGYAIRDLVKAYKSHEFALSFRGGAIAEYISAQLEIGELVDWTVALLEGEGEALPYAQFGDVRTVERAQDKDEARLDLYKVRTVLSPRDEAIDLTAEEYELAMAATRNARPEKDSAPAHPGGIQIRCARAARRGLLLLYPLHPKFAGSPVRTPIIAPVVSFPDSRHARTFRVMANTVFQRQEFVG